MDERNQFIDISDLATKIEQELGQPPIINRRVELCLDCRPFTGRAVHGWLGQIARINANGSYVIQPSVPENAEQVTALVIQLGRTLAATISDRDVTPLAIGYVLKGLNTLIHERGTVHSFQQTLLAFDCVALWKTLPDVHTLKDLGRAIVRAQELHERCQQNGGMSAYSFFPSSLRQLAYVKEDRSPVNMQLFNNITVEWHLKNRRRMIWTDREFDRMLEELEHRAEAQQDREHVFSRYLVELIRALGSEPEIIRVIYDGLVNLDLTGLETFDVQVHDHNNGKICIEITPLGGSSSVNNPQTAFGGNPSMN